SNGCFRELLSPPRLPPEAAAGLPRPRPARLDAQRLEVPPDHLRLRPEEGEGEGPMTTETKRVIQHCRTCLCGHPRYGRGNSDLLAEYLDLLERDIDITTKLYPSYRREHSELKWAATRDVYDKAWENDR